MGVVVLIGRILFAVLFIGSGLGHLSQNDDVAAYAEARGVKNARIWVLVSGVAFLIGGLGVALGIWADLAALGLGVLALATAVFVHHPWTDEGDTRQVEFTQFMKDLSLAGGGISLWILISALGSSLPFMITGPRFHLSL